MSLADAIKTARIEGDELTACKAEIEALRGLLDDAMCPGLAPHERRAVAVQLRQLDAVVGRR
jgi:hypothetical protein